MSRAENPFQSGVRWVKKIFTGGRIEEEVKIPTIAEAASWSMRQDVWLGSVGEKAKLGSASEVPIATFMESLSTPDRANVTAFVQFMYGLSSPLPYDLAVTAVGSATKGVDTLSRTFNDIDLRVLHSVKGVAAREVVVEQLRDSIRTHLIEHGLEFEENENTLSTIITKSGSRFADFYNRDPSFIVNFGQGHPLHVSLSGADNPPLEKYLTYEVDRARPFSLLFRS